MVNSDGNWGWCGIKWVIQKRGRYGNGCTNQAIYKPDDTEIPLFTLLSQHSLYQTTLPSKTVHCLFMAKTVHAPTVVLRNNLFSTFRQRSWIWCKKAWTCIQLIMQWCGFSLRHIIQFYDFFRWRRCRSFLEGDGEHCSRHEFEWFCYDGVIWIVFQSDRVMLVSCKQTIKTAAPTSKIIINTIGANITNFSCKRAIATYTPSEPHILIITFSQKQQPSHDHHHPHIATVPMTTIT